MNRSAVAIWKGGPGAGEGTVSTSSGVINNALYSFGSGTGSEPCTSPSEMLAAAVASCMSLMVAREMAGAGLKDKYVKTESPLTLEDKGSHWEITGIHLAGCGKTRFEADAAPRNSLVSTAQPDKKKPCVEKTSSNWMCSAT